MVQEGELDLIPAPTEPCDTDSLEIAHVYGIVLTPPEPPAPAPVRENTNLGVSFILGGIFILFLVIALRFHNNIKYAVKMFRNLVETRTRQNVFDDTVRETSLIALLNVLWCACAGIVGYVVFRFLNPQEAATESPSLGLLWGMAVATLYSLFMWLAYMGIGWVFSDRNHALLWVKGFGASQALMSLPFFLTALLGLCRPETAIGVGIASATVFILVKLVFIWKGYRIFFSQFSSWVLFLCYLCSLEIVPLILCYRLASFLGNSL